MNLDRYSNAQLATAFSAITGIALKKFENRDKAVSRIAAALAERGLTEDAIEQALTPGAEHGETGPVVSPNTNVITPDATRSIDMSDEQVPAFLRRTSPMAEIETVAPAPKTPAEIEYDAKVEEFFKLSETDGRAAFIAAIEYGKSLGSKPARTPRATRKTREPGSTKREKAAALLMRETGATAREILDETGWPAVSVPAIAKASGLTLRQEKDGKATRYYGAKAEAA